MIIRNERVARVCSIFFSDDKNYVDVSWNPEQINKYFAELFMGLSLLVGSTEIQQCLALTRRYYF